MSTIKRVTVNDGKHLNSLLGSTSDSDDNYTHSISNNSENVNKKFSERDYSYESLTSKSDMQLTTVDDSEYFEPSKETRKAIVERAIDRVKKAGKTNSDGNALIHVSDIDTDVIVSKASLKHSIDRRLSVVAPVIVNIAPILENSIILNEMNPRNEAISSYILMGAAKNQKGELYVASFVVNKFTGELSAFDVLYSANAKTEPAGRQGPELSPNKGVSLTDSTISISNLLDFVNRYFPDILPEDVLRHYGHTQRPLGKLGESALYQDRTTPEYTNRQILVNALEHAENLSAADQNRLKIYKKNLDKYNDIETQLSEVSRQIHDIAFTKGTDRTQLKPLYKKADAFRSMLSAADKKLLQIEATEPIKKILDTEKKRFAKKDVETKPFAPNAQFILT